MSDFANAKQSSGLGVKLWRGERMCLIGMDVAVPEADFVGFSIEVKSPAAPVSSRCETGSTSPMTSPSIRLSTATATIPHLKRRSRNSAGCISPTSRRAAPTPIASPSSTCRATTAQSRHGRTLDIPLDAVVYDGFLDVGFARNFASSQAYQDKYQGNQTSYRRSPTMG